MSDMASFYAHSLEGRPIDEWQGLEDHLRNVAERAKKFAKPFNAGDWAYLAGLWHDLGKYSEEFQAYLLNENGFEAHIENVPGIVDHSSAGAKHAVNLFEIVGHLLAYQIAGHHSGLLDGRSDGACLDNRLRNGIIVPSNVPTNLLHKQLPELPAFIQRAFSRKDAFTISFFVRMLFSCLVDADFLDTERFMTPEKYALRTPAPENIFDLMEKALNLYANNFILSDAPINYDREEIRKACLAKAQLERGFFSLTVPTGGGKTLSSLAFALRHLHCENKNKTESKMRRIVYVIPFTTIIEQTADEFRKVMGVVEGMDVDKVVIEHHSNFSPDKETPYSRLACENWDAPLIVTTSVQFYESLFANRTSACRKLHNLENSVIIIDEAQTIPVDYLKPCLKALNELVSNYGASVVLCTATQPTLHYKSDFSIGIVGVREIISDPPALYKRLKRVHINNIGSLSDNDLVALLVSHRQVLCIVNTVGHAQKLSKLLGQSLEHFHLTAAKCPKHRSLTLQKIRDRLKEGNGCRVISTQLMEAGVDVDFPVVYRSMAGLDSIAQAAGRCNRHGKMKSLGSMFIFKSEHESSEKFIADTVNCANQIVDIYHDDPLDLRAINHYFKLYYWDQTARWDAKHICDSFQLVQQRNFPFLFDFAKVAVDFRIIQGSRQIVIPWGDEGHKLCEKLRVLSSLNWEVVRELQQYSVSVRERIWWNRLDRGITSLFDGSLGILISPEFYYSENYGLRFEDPSGEVFFA